MSITHRAVPQTQATYVYDAIKSEILRGALAGGQPVLQAEWAERMGTSVTPVREAIRRLGQDGLVETAPHRGTRVIHMTTDSLDQIYDMRALIVPMQIRRSMGRMSESDIQQARTLCDHMNALTADQTAEFIELNNQFHDLLLQHDDSWTSRVIQMLQAAASPYVSLSIAEQPSQLLDSNKDHYELLEATIAGDVDKVIETELRHIESTRVLARTYLEQLADN